MSGSLSPRSWDTNFFGFSVAEIEGRELDDDSLAAHLLAARRDGIELVYWRANLGREPVPDLLTRFAGQLVDRRVVYRLPLEEADLGGVSTSGYAVREQQPGPATPELIELAIAAGAFSRFKADRRFPEALFEALYRTWMERSAAREIADVVLVAANQAGSILGMSTISVDGETATIGLISVRQEARGRGIGRALVASCHRWMADRGVYESRVATQQLNEHACRLYERSGYRIADRSLVYHFWPAYKEDGLPSPSPQTLTACECHPPAKR